MIFHENRLPANDSHEISYLICYFGKSGKILYCRLLQIVGGGLRVKVFVISTKISLTGSNILLCIYFAYSVIFHAFLQFADFFQNQLFQKFLSVILSECRTVWIQIRPDILSGLIWIQTVCKGYQQTTLVDRDR